MRSVTLPDPRFGGARAGQQGRQRHAVAMHAATALPPPEVEPTGRDGVAVAVLPEGLGGSSICVTRRVARRTAMRRSDNATTPNPAIATDPPVPRTGWANANTATTSRSRRAGRRPQEPKTAYTPQNSSPRQIIAIGRRHRRRPGGFGYTSAKSRSTSALRWSTATPHRRQPTRDSDAA